METNTCKIVVGRLLEIRVDAGYRTTADVDEMISMIGQALAGLPPREGVIIAADWRRCKVMTPETADRARVMMTGANPRVLRSGVLISPTSPTQVMQVMRVVREANHPDRRVLTSPGEMIAWLGPAARPDERAQLDRFLARADEAPGG